MKPSHYFPPTTQARVETDPSFSFQLNLQGLGQTPFGVNSFITGQPPEGHRAASRKYTRASNGTISERSFNPSSVAQPTLPSVDAIENFEIVVTEERKIKVNRSRHNSRTRKYTGSSERGMGVVLKTQEAASDEAEPGSEGHKRAVTEAFDEKQFRYTRQRMMFIPQNIGNISTESNKSKPFLSFNELSKTATNSHSKMLSEILKRGADLKKPASKSPIAGYSFTPRENEQLKVVRNILKFNKMQKANYMIQMRTEEEKTLSPLREMKEIREKKLKTMPPVRVVSSRKIHHQVFDFVEKKPTETSALVTREKSEEKTKIFESPRVRIIEPKALSTKNLQNVSNVVSVSEELGLYAGSPGWKFFWHSGKADQEKWKPDAREGHTLTTVGNKTVVLYGGIGNKLFDKVQIYDPGKESWTTPETVGEVPREGRHGHSACEYKGNVVIFGGEKKYNHALGFRESLNDVYTFNPEKSEWKSIKSLGKNMDGRRNHTAAVHSKVLYVYGGIGTDNRVSKDVYCFGLKSQMWSQIFPSGNREFGQAYHTMCACFNDKKDRIKKKAVEEGLYVFGGKDQEGKILSSLKYLALNGKDGQWKYPSIKGTPPAARYSHSMVFYQTLQLLLIYGGKNETLYEKNKELSLNDIKILNLETMTWGISCSVGVVPKIGRSHHATAMYKTSLLIFGGVTFSEYASPDMKKVEINQMAVKTLINERTETEESEEILTKQTSKSSSPKKRYLKRQDSYEPEPKAPEKKEFVSFLPMPGKDQQIVEEKLNKLRSTIKSVITKGGILSQFKRFGAGGGQTREDF